ncbi:MAG: hypothetical protein ACXAAH_14170 [Promethearchaeota archaeon]|jgi:hypothetical protein
MNKKNIEKWVDTAEVGSSVVYYTGNLAEDRCYNRNVGVIPNLFAEQAEKGKVDFFQKRKTVMQKSATPKRPVFDYIARKIK